MTNENNNSEIVLYSDDNGQIKVETRIENNSIWLSQSSIAELFRVQRPAITKHLTNIFLEGELDENLVSSILKHTATDGKIYKTKFYNLDTIISVGYRVNSRQATRFRIWATKVLHEFIQKGFVLDDYRLKYGSKLDDDYYDELLERIQNIRTSERRFYQKLLISTLHQLIMIKTLKPLKSSFKPFKIKCTGLHLIKLQLKLVKS
jgi:hypothetical protein